MKQDIKNFFAAQIAAHLAVWGCMFILFGAAAFIAWDFSILTGKPGWGYRLIEVGAIVIGIVTIDRIHFD